MSKVDLFFEKPIMNAAGILGFSPEPKGRIDVSHFGAFVTNPISLAPRKPASGERVIKFPGGCLIHTGYPNPGFRLTIEKHRRRWSNSPVPVVVNLLAQDAHAIREMVQRLEGLDGVVGIEIGIPPGSEPDLVLKMVMAAVGELAIIVRIPFEDVHHTNMRSPWIELLQNPGIDAISMSPQRGCLLDSQNNLVSGRLFGPSQYPQTLAAVGNLLDTGIPVIASGGVYNKQDINILLELGVKAVQLDTVLWHGGNNISKII